jgi:ZIP family zinc transporter
MSALRCCSAQAQDSPRHSAACSASWSESPASACVAALVLMPFLNATLVNLLLSGAAGIMIAISLDQLTPAAKTYGSTHTPIIGMIGGMMVVVAGLLLMRLV